MDKKKIEEITRKFYSSLYSTNGKDIKQTKEFIERHWNIRITEDNQKKMNAAFSQMEIREALKYQKKGKTPGPDGIIVEYYEALEEEVMPIYKEVIEVIRTSKTIPASWKESTTTLIPKPAQDKEDIKNYSPISLLNVDYKFFATIFSGRLKAILPELIHQD